MKNARNNEVGFGNKEKIVQIDGHSDEEKSRHPLRFYAREKV